MPGCPLVHLVEGYLLRSAGSFDRLREVASTVPGIGLAFHSHCKNRFSGVGCCGLGSVHSITPRSNECYICPVVNRSSGPHRSRARSSWILELRLRRLVCYLEPWDCRDKSSQSSRPPRHRLQLENNINLNRIANATIVLLAAWSHAGKVKWQGDSAESVWHKIDELSGIEIVHAVTVDDLVVRCALKRVDCIKLDVEGAEAEVLKGAEQSIQRFHPALFNEVHGTLQALEVFLTQSGYAIDKTIFGGITANHGYVPATVK